ncbi:MAG: cation diffusion facilitator family transporter [Calditrichia bacterium]
MSHSHAHSHQHTETSFGRAFLIGIILNVTYIIVEAGYGLYINSLALIADAGHNLSDVLGLVMAWGASYLVTKSARGRYTYGFKKSSIIAAFMNAMLLMAAIGIIIWEAIERFNQPQSIDGQTVMIVAGIGVLINTATAMLFFSGRKQDLNIKGAFLHMAADAAISLGVVGVGLILMFTDLYWIDPVVSIIIALIIFWGTWDLFKDSLKLSLDAAPKEIEMQDVKDYLLSLDEVDNFHDLHIWAMSTTETALTVHLTVPGLQCEHNQLLDKINHDMKHKFNIVHTTIQIEDVRDEDCQQNHI